MRRARTLNYAGQTQTLPLFARQNRTRTSRAAAANAEPRCPSQRDRVLEDIRSCRAWGTNQSAIVTRLRIPLQSVTARVSELGEMGAIVALTEERETGAGGSGLVFVTREHINGRPLEAWPPPKVNWKALAIAAEARASAAEHRAAAAEARVAHLERLMGLGAAS